MFSLLFIGASFAQNQTLSIYVEDTDIPFILSSLDPINCISEDLSVVDVTNMFFMDGWDGMTNDCEHLYLPGGNLETIEWGAVAIELTSGAIHIENFMLWPTEMEFDLTNNSLILIANMEEEPWSCAIWRWDLNSQELFFITEFENIDFCGQESFSDMHCLDHENQILYSVFPDYIFVSTDLVSGEQEIHTLNIDSPDFPLLFPLGGLFYDHELQRIFYASLISVDFSFGIIELNPQTWEMQMICAVESENGQASTYNESEHLYSIIYEASEGELSKHLTYDMTNGNLVDSCLYGNDD